MENKKEKLLSADSMDTIYIAYMDSKQLERHKKWDGISSISSFLIAMVLLLIVFVLWVPISIQRRGLPSRMSQLAHNHECYVENECQVQLVESIPDGLNYSEGAPKFLSTYEAWNKLLDIAHDSIDIGSFYWSLRGADFYNHSTAAQGEHIFQRILANAVNKSLKIRIAESTPTENQPSFDTEVFKKKGAAIVRTVDFPRLIGDGVLHTKLWIVDKKHFYLGSANMDWRSLTQVKEVGVLAQNCNCMAKDVMKIFKAYWYLGLNTSTVPKEWPAEYATEFNWQHPMIVKFNQHYTMPTLFSSSPPALVPKGRTNDLESILNVIATARSFVYIAVMDYFPLMIYTKHVKFWPYIDDALRKAALERQVTVKLLISWWKHSRPSEDYFLKSLQSLSSVFKGVDIEIRRFVVPADEDQSKIPFARVNHNKYMVTDNVAYIGTSNWSGDYFTNTAGIGLIFRDADTAEEAKQTIRTDLLSIFERDWESPYALGLQGQNYF